MRLIVVFVLCSVLALGVVAGGTWAKDTPGKLAGYRFTEIQIEPSVPPEIGGTMFQTAAATTTILGWYQFDNANGTPNKQGWTEKDMTTQIKKYWHVAGTPCSDAITPIAGTKSMWCGQWTSTLDPWCGWAALPGYGLGWDQSLETTVSNVTTVSYKIAWDSEPGYDYTYAEWWDGTSGIWVADATVNAGAGAYDGAGGPLTENLTSPYGATKFRFHVTSDTGWCDEDGLWDTAQGAAMVDDLAINGGATETFEGAACNAQTVGSWTATIPPGFGEYGELHSAATVVQEDPCLKPLSNMWGWYDNPAVTNYACGGWPLQGAMPYGPDASGLYLDNEIWSPWIPVTGTGNSYLLEFLVYYDLPLDNLQFFVWHARYRNTVTGGCPSGFADFNFVYYSGTKLWGRGLVDFGTFVPAAVTDVQIAVGAVDMCGAWCGVYGTGACHSHAPLVDQVKVMRVPSPGPQWTARTIDFCHDTFPENGNITSTSYARCDMAQDIIPSTNKRICTGDSLKIVVTDPVGLAADNTGGRTDTKAVYVFVKVADRFGNPVAGKNGLAIQSPDNKRYAADPAAGLLRYPYVAGIAPAGWDAYRCDLAKTAGGGAVKDTYCADLMDISAFLPTGWHANENLAANVGIFSPGDVIQYFFAAKNTAGVWSYGSRTWSGQGAWFRTNNVNQCIASPMEWSVLPDAGRLAGDAGDILYVDDADGFVSNLYFDWAFTFMNIQNRVDRFDVLGPGSVVGNSLASRVKNIQTQMIGDGPTEIYQKVLWNCAATVVGMGDGGTANGGSSWEKSNDFGLCEFFLTNHPNNPGWAYWGDNVVDDWSTLVGINAVNVKSVYMNHTLVGGDQRTRTGIISPKVSTVAPPPANPWHSESFYAFGGCVGINNFDMPGASGASIVTHRYNAQANAPAAVYQATANAAQTTARFFLAGYGVDFVRDDDLDGVPDYAPHLRKTLVAFQNVIDEPIGIDPVAFANALEDNYPNPFNPTTTIRYSIASAGHVTLKIYNAAGQLVRTLVDEEQLPTTEGFSVAWNGTNDRGQSVSSGVYFYQLTAKNFEQTKKMVLLK